MAQVQGILKDHVAKVTHHVCYLMTGDKKGNIDEFFSSTRVCDIYLSDFD